MARAAADLGPLGDALVILLASVFVFALVLFAPFLLPLAALAGLGYYLYGYRLRRAFEERWADEHRLVLLVYSSSPAWKEHIEQEWLPRIGARLVAINWSEGEQWPEDFGLERRVYRRWGRWKTRSPIAIGFVPGGAVRAINFGRAFLDARQGEPHRLREAEEDLDRLIDEIDDALRSRAG